MRPLDDFVVRWTAKMPVPFVEVINIPVTTDTLPDVWGTAMLQSNEREDVSLGLNPWVEERGELLPVLFARSGKGRSVLDTALAALRLHFHGYMTTDNNLHYRQVIGPQETEVSEGEWWRLAFLVPYTLQSRRVEPVPQ
jgi:hypothetical protein